MQAFKGCAAFPVFPGHSCLTPQPQQKPPLLSILAVLACIAATRVIQEGSPYVSLSVTGLGTELNQVVKGTGGASAGSFWARFHVSWISFFFFLLSFFKSVVDGCDDFNWLVNHLILDPLPQDAPHHVITSHILTWASCWGGLQREMDGCPLQGGGPQGQQRTPQHHGVGSFASLLGGSLKHTEGLCGQTFLSGFRINSKSRPHPGLGMMSAILEWSGRVGRGFLPPGECEFARIWSIMRPWAARRAEHKGEEHRPGGQSEPGASTDRLAGKPAPSFPADPTRVSCFMGTSSM